MNIRVAIVEDDEQVRENLSRLVSGTAGFECVATFATGELALEGLPRRRTDVVLMDINLPGISGVECARQLKANVPGIEIVMLTVYDDSDRIFQALQMGASGYLLKRSPASEILRAVEEVHRGGAPMSSYIARKVVQSFCRQGPSDKTGGESIPSRDGRARLCFPRLHEQGDRRCARPEPGDRPGLPQNHLQQTARALPDRGGDEVSAVTACRPGQRAPSAG